MSLFVFVVALSSALLIPFGLAVALDFGGFAGRVAGAITGGISTTRASTDRLWSVLPLSLGLGLPIGLMIGWISSTASVVVGGAAIVIYYVAMMRLGWLYTPPKRRVLGPLFWTRRAAAIPLAAFFSYAAILWLATEIQPFH